MNYKKMIIRLLKKIHNEKFLRRIYISLRDYVGESEGVAGKRHIRTLSWNFWTHWTPKPCRAFTASSGA